MRPSSDRSSPAPVPPRPRTAISSPQLDRAADIIGAFFAGLGIVLSTIASIAQWSRHEMTPRNTIFTAILLPLVALTCGWVMTDVLRRRRARTALRVHTALCLLGVLMAALFWQGAPGQPGPALAHSAGLGAVASWACLPWPLAVADIVVTGVIGGAVLAGTSGLDSLNWSNSAYYSALGMVAAMGWITIVRAVHTAQAAADLSVQAQSRLIEAEEAMAESNRWDGLIHDRVLNALGTAARATSSAVDAATRTLARDALEALRRTASLRPSGSLAERLSSQAAALGLRPHCAIDGEPPAELAEVFLRAAGEALSNTARHSDSDLVAITGHFDADRGELAISDYGRGFDPELVPEARRGLRSSIAGAMEVHGGSARIISSPGAGTTVWLRWRATEEDAARMPPLGSFRAMVGFFLLALGISVTLGWWDPGPVVRLGPQVVGTLLLIAATAAAMYLPRLSPPVIWILVAVTVICQALMLGNLRPSINVVWAEWFLGFGIGVYAPLAWRTRWRLWPAIAAAGWPVVTITGALLNGSDPLWMLYSRASSFTFPVAMSMAAAWAAGSMERCFTSIRTSQANTLETTRRRARADAVRHEAERRLATIEGEPLEMLERLAAGAPLTAPVRHECRLLEASTRDLLVAPFIIDETMRREFRRARERGAAVTITGDEPVGAGSQTAARTFQRLSAAMAGSATRGDRLTCRWRPHSELFRASVVLACDTAGPGCGAPQAQPRDLLTRELREILSAATDPVEIQETDDEILAMISRGSPTGKDAPGDGVSPRPGLRAGDAVSGRRPAAP